MYQRMFTVMIWFALYVPDFREQTRGCVHLCIIRGMHLWLIREAFPFLPLVFFFFLAVCRGCLVLSAIFPLWFFFSSLVFLFLPCAATFCCIHFFVCVCGDWNLVLYFVASVSAALSLRAASVGLILHSLLCCTQSSITEQCSFED